MVGECEGDTIYLLVDRKWGTRDWEPAYVSEVPSALLPSAWLHPLKLPLPLQTQPSAREPNTACGPVGDISYLSHDPYSMSLDKYRVQNIYNMEYLPCLKNLTGSLSFLASGDPQFFFVCLFQGVTSVESCRRQTSDRFGASTVHIL